ncbi:cytochrome c [bacterium BMS3Abin07]|nr:cytochrome c [bacterium BMS3Abin07]GBE33168.1 cytochrome c [bacterium BMS3Bbin05]HDL19764.1 c-type cytochrome [Nitrospirota bacterium]HDO21907.1 c-type cytochrome [Nitrospirota bacterium]HDZ88456.1 c-type cytochrome [Nitrospirota bacterium]
MKSLKVIIIALSLVFSSLVFASTAEYPKIPEIDTSNYPKGEVGRLVKLGEDIMNNTYKHPLTKDLVGNKLTCTNCHLAGSDGKPGSAKGIGTFIGTAAVFPAYSKREKTVQTLQDRINNCFMRSMNGTRPIIDTEASIAMATYITWLSQGIPMKMDEKRPCGLYNSNRWAKSVKKFAKIQRKATHQNYLNGKKIYETKCAMCHGKNGQGIATFPPLWGKNSEGEWLSYNTGAGMSKLNKGAAWVQSNMPIGQGGTLTDQEAADIMLYVDAQPGADFDLQKGLFPREKMGYYNSKVLKEHHSVRSNFKAFGLDVDKIRGVIK